MNDSLSFQKLEMPQSFRHVSSKPNKKRSPDHKVPVNSPSTKHSDENVNIHNGPISSRSSFGHYNEIIKQSNKKKIWEDKHKDYEIWWKKTGQLKPKAQTDIPMGYTIPKTKRRVNQRRSNYLNNDTDELNSPFNKLTPLPGIDASNNVTCAQCHRPLLAKSRNTTATGHSCSCDTPRAIHNVPVNTIMPSVTRSHRSSCTE